MNLEKLIKNVAAVLIAVVSLVTGFGATHTAHAVPLSCADGGVCVIGDIGPGGGKVFFSRGSGAFSEHFDAIDTSPMCQSVRGTFMESMDCRDEVIDVVLTSSEVPALQFDYLEVAPISAQAVTAWASTGSPNNFNAEGTKIGTGLANSLAMVAARPNDSATQNAGKYALDLVSGGKDDWFLPSVDELSLLYVLNQRDHSVGVFADDYFFSSTNDCGCARQIRFGSEYHSAYVTIDSSIRYLTRPVRSFSAQVVVVPSSTTTTTNAPTTTVASTTTVAPTTTVMESPVVTTAQSQLSVATIAPSIGSTTTVLAPMKFQAPRATTTTTTTPVVASVASTRVAVPPMAPVLSPGEVGAVVGGEKISTTLSRSDNQIVAKAGAISATVSGLLPNGERIELDADGNLRLEENAKIVIESTGYEAEQDVEVWMFSTPSLLGKLSSAATGAISGTLDIPADLQSGDHRLVLKGVNNDGESFVLGVGMMFGSADSGTSAASRLLIGVPVALAVLIGLFIPAVSRRRRKQGPAI
jgi:hypothetical protein